VLKIFDLAQRTKNHYTDHFFYQICYFLSH